MNEPRPRPKRSLLTEIFISTGELRLRAGWRLLIQALLQIFLTIVCGLAIFVPFGVISGLKDLSSLTFLAFGEAVELISVTLSVYLARRFLDKRSFQTIGFKIDGHTVADILTGIGITFVMMGLTFLAEREFGWLTWRTFAWAVEPVQNVLFQLLLFLAVFVVVGWNEELMSRGYHLKTIASGLNLPWGLIISSAIFGFLHLGNPHATLVGAAGIFLAGLFLAYAYLRTHQLWLSIGLHVGWNFFEGVVFGFPVSGLDIYHLARITVSGPVLWTGGEFGPEAGLIMLPVIVIGAALIYLYTRSRTAT